MDSNNNNNFHNCNDNNCTRCNPRNTPQLSPAFIMALTPKKALSERHWSDYCRFDFASAERGLRFSDLVYDDYERVEVDPRLLVDTTLYPGQPMLSGYCCQLCGAEGGSRFVYGTVIDLDRPNIAFRVCQECICPITDEVKAMMCHSYIRGINGDMCDCHEKKKYVKHYKKCQLYHWNHKVDMQQVIIFIRTFIITFY